MGKGSLKGGSHRKNFVGHEATENVRHEKANKGEKLRLVRT